MADAKREVEKKEASLPESGERTRERRVFRPDVDILEKKEEMVIIADMPGVD